MNANEKPVIASTPSGGSASEKVTLNESGDDVMDWADEKPATDEELKAFKIVGQPFEE
jgi:hypothetical protein